MEDKPINWIGTSRDDICSFPEDARRKAGFQLRAVQRGEAPVDFKSMPIVGKGAAVFFGETQPRISNLMNGDIDRFAIDKLVQMLSRAGMEVRVLVTPQGLH
ncbi:MAG: hypothetical protein RLZZ135_1456 [Cyanobacteriota bacterium]|jgi:hypothetical protein